MRESPAVTTGSLTLPHQVIRDQLVANSRQMGDILNSGLQKLQSRYSCIGDVRGRGLMAGVEIVADRESKTPALALAKQIGDEAYKRLVPFPNHPSYFN